MKILDRLMYRAGGYSSDKLANSSTIERRQVRQQGRASIISIIASTLSWFIASSLFAGQGGTASLVILGFVVLFVPWLTFSLNRTLFYNADVGKNNDFLLPLSKIALITLATFLSYEVLSNISGYGKILPFILAIFDLYPIILKLYIGQTIAGRREQARLEREHMRGDLKKREYEREVGLKMVHSKSLYFGPHDINFEKSNLEKKEKLALSYDYLKSYVESNHLYKFSTFIAGAGFLIFGISNSSLEVIWTSTLLLLITFLIISYEKILKYRVQRGFFASNSREVRDFISYLNDKHDDIDFTDGSGGKKDSLVNLSDTNKTDKSSASLVAGGGSHE